jgi:ABC-type glycerol-3-phosphate transport system substrate-binding protein
VNRKFATDFKENIVSTDKRLLSRRGFLKLGSAGAAALAAGPLFRSTAVRAQSRTHLVYIWPFAAAQAVQEEIVNRFNEQSSTIEVELQIVPQDSVLPALTTAFSSGPCRRRG